MRTEWGKRTKWNVWKQNQKENDTERELEGEVDTNMNGNKKMSLSRET